MVTPTGPCRADILTTGRVWRRPNWERGQWPPPKAAGAGLIDVLFGVSSGPVLPPPADLLDQLTECGVAFRSASEPIDTFAPMGRVLLQLLGIVDSNGK